MAADRPTLIGLGEVLWDLLPEGKQFGGAPANFAYHAKAMGADAHVVSAVGDDKLGREILGRLDGLGVDRQFVAVDAEHSTGTVSVELDEHGKPPTRFASARSPSVRRSRGLRSAGSSKRRATAACGSSTSISASTTSTPESSPRASGGPTC